MKQTHPSVTLLVVLVLALIAPSAIAKQIEAPPRPEFRAVRADTAPTIDGVLDDAAWASAPEITGFTQRMPDEGKPPTEKTVVKIVYDEAAIYVGATMYDSQPVTTQLGRRDSDLESDWFRFYVDPHHDRQTGAGFEVNPSNVQVDMNLYNDNWDDWDWDAVWVSATKITDDGWTVEMRIPYSQLRFPNRDHHVWGFNVSRIIKRRNEDDRLVFTPRTESGFVSRFADLAGIDGIHPRRSLEIVPYTVTRLDLNGTTPAANPFVDSTKFDQTMGVDLKYGVTSNLTLTGTINPDFGQVEVDPAVVNLTQFEQYYPEKRPFFLEGGSLFSFGQGGSNNNFNFNINTPDFFYSRRIGRAPQALYRANGDYVDAPHESTILGAIKLTGKTASGWTIAALNAVTSEEQARVQDGASRFKAVVEPETNYLVSRIAKDFGTKSRVGVLFTAVNRDFGKLDFGNLRSGAYAGGIDGYRFFGDRDVIWEWFVGGSRIEGSASAISASQRSSARYYQRPDSRHLSLDPTLTTLDGWAARTMVAKQTGHWRYNFQVQSYSPGFETNDVGFMTRTDIINSHAAILYVNPDPGKRTRMRQFWAGKYQNWNFDGDLIGNGIAGSGYVQFHNYTYADVWGGANAERYDDRLTRGGPVARVPTSWYLGGDYGTDSRKPFYIEVYAENSENDLGGYSHSAGVTAVYRPGTNVSMRFGPSFSRSSSFAQYVRTIADPTAGETYDARYVFAGLDQRTLEITTRLDWTFSPRLTLQLYLQPFIASGRYHDFKQLARPRTMDYAVYGVDQGSIDYDSDSNRYQIDPDGTGPAAPFSIANPDFNFRSLRGSAVLRWEYRPGSAVYFVWNENRAATANVGDFDLSRDISALASAPSDDVFLIKFSYWLGR